MTMVLLLSVLGVTLPLALVALLTAVIWWLVLAFRLDTKLALLSLFCGVFGLVLLVRYWDELKRPTLLYCAGMLLNASSLPLIMGIRSHSMVLMGDRITEESRTMTP